MYNNSNEKTKHIKFRVNRESRLTICYAELSKKMLLFLA